MDYIEVKGSYYEVGKELGKKTSDTLKVILEDFKNGQLYAKISAFINEPKGKNILNNFRLTTHTYCENYINELQGLADGAGVSFDDLFLFNVDHEFVSIFDHVPEGSHDVIYTSLYDGCTNISMETKHGEVLFAHTEDINPITRDMGIMVNFIITNEEGKTVENFVDYYIPGFLSGSKLGYNSHGVVMGMNCVIQRGINLNGIPRKFMCRSLCNVKNADEARQKLEAKPGMATSYVFQYAQKTKNGIESTVIETANTDTKQHVTSFKPGTFYHHCNILQHLKFPCHPEESSIHRAAVISQYLNRNEEFNKDLLCRILSDAQDPKFPIYRNGAKPDYLVTAVTGIFNATEGTFEIYRDKPVSSSPVFTFHVPRS